MIQPKIMPRHGAASAQESCCSQVEEPLRPAIEPVASCCGAVPAPAESDCCHEPSPSPSGGCCGSDVALPPVLPERPGYAAYPFVQGVVSAPVGDVPRVATQLTWDDHLGGFRVRWGIRRNQYRVTPGLYAVGRPTADDPVLVTANYKLTFDALRRELTRCQAWILVLDTKGVNVWCAAGKGTFGTAELIRRVQTSRLAEVVTHRKLVLPQLGAVGVAGHQVKQACGFRVVWGPIRAADIPAFLANGQKADETMRRVTFTLWERTVLVPVELAAMARTGRWLVPLLFVISGIGLGIFSFGSAWSRGWPAVGALVMGIVGGAVLGPVLLPWLPGRAFAFKGALTGMVAALAGAAWYHSGLGPLEILALLLFTTSVSSYLTMNYTGTTPFTSPTGVEKEMRIAIPVQIGAVALAAAAWLAAPFVA